MPLVSISWSIFLSGFGFRVMLASQNELRTVPPSSDSWKIWRGVDTSSTLNTWFSSAVKPSGSGLFYFGRFLVAECVSLGVHVYALVSDLGRFQLLFLSLL